MSRVFIVHVQSPGEEYALIVATYLLTRSSPVPLLMTL